MPKENLPGAKTVFVHESVVCNDGVYQVLLMFLTSQTN